LKKSKKNKKDKNINATLMQLNSNIKLIRELSGMRQEDFAELIKTNLSNLKTYENTNVKPKANILSAIGKIAGVTIEDLKDKKLSPQDINIQVEKVENPTQKPSTPAQDISLQAIKDLTETGKLREENYKMMINNESRLINLLEDKLTVRDSKDTGVASAQVMRGILVGMAKIASGTRWHSEQEAIRELGRLIDEPVLGSKKGESIQTDGGT
jgi:transcriptional regulator with XRE-family HTH domain